MCRHADSRTGSASRRGVALLMAIVTLVVLALCALALWHTHAGAIRSDRLRDMTLRRDAEADSMLAISVAAVQGGAWRGTTLGQSLTIASQRTREAEHRATLTRVGWQSLLVRGLASGRSGVRGVPSRGEHRLVVPLRMPLRMPMAAVTGGRAWAVDPLAALSVAAAAPPELGCRAGVVPDTMAVDTLPVALDAAAVTLLDPDTVSAPLRGVFRLIRDRIVRPMVVDGMVESVTGLLLGADLQLAGVLVVQGSVQSAGGRLDVTGAVITRDSGGGRSVLGNGDRVRYDACAIRRAMERLTRPAPAATWTIVGHF